MILAKGFKLVLSQIRVANLQNEKVSTWYRCKELAAKGFSQSIRLKWTADSLRALGHTSLWAVRSCRLHPFSRMKTSINCFQWSPHDINLRTVKKIIWKRNVSIAKQKPKKNGKKVLLTLFPLGCSSPKLISRRHFGNC